MMWPLMKESVTAAMVRVQFVLALAIFSLARCGLCQVLPTAKGNVTLFDAKFQPSPVGPGVSDQRFNLEGSLRNDTDFTILAVSFQLVPVGPSGEVRSDACNFGYNCSVALFQPIKSGDTVPLNQPRTFIFIDRGKAVTSINWGIKWGLLFRQVRYPAGGDPRSPL